MKKKIIAIILLVIGAGILSYPIVGNIINVVKQNSVQEEYNNIVQQMDNQTKNQIKSDAEEYNKKIAKDDFDIIYQEQDFDDGSEYGSVLDIGMEAIAFIKIPKIDIELPIYRGTSTLTLEKGIGHLTNSSLPVGGESSHCILTGHTGMPSSILFTDISKLIEGDKFYIQYLDEIHAYQVDQIKVVDPNDNSDLNIVPGKDYVTLLTCYPYGINSHRLLVRGTRVPFNGEIKFGSNGEIESITDKSEDTVINDKELNELKTMSPTVSVYGYNISLKTIIIVTAVIVAVIVAAIIIAIVRNIKKDKKPKENSD